jgi:hypothetical protein
MDGDRFDELTARLGQADGTRRSLLRRAGVGGFAALLAALGLIEADTTEVAAGRRRRRRRRRGGGGGGGAGGGSSSSSSSSAAGGGGGGGGGGGSSSSSGGGSGANNNNNNNNNTIIGGGDGTGSGDGTGGGGTGTGGTPLVCSGGTINCGGRCVDLATSPTNCGSCGEICPASTPSCAGGNCCVPFGEDCFGDPLLPCCGAENACWGGSCRPCIPENDNCFLAGSGCCPGLECEFVGPLSVDFECVPPA